jgi:DNA repair exonuclease SbcCD nuclease subunit
VSKYLFTSDFHLTSLPRDEYRWEIFPWLKRRAIRKKVDAVFILGDLTDRKDQHPATLTNRLITELRSLSEAAEVVILKGNHDYIDPDLPYFGFLNSERMSYFSVPGIFRSSDDVTFLLLPHTNRFRGKNKNRAWKEWKFDDYDFVLLHQSVTGSRAASGKILEGVPVSTFKGDTTFIAGDIHPPQKIGQVHYCGSPHPLNFGDNFDPRVLYWNGSELKSLRRFCIKKAQLFITDPKDIKRADVSGGDQVRVTLELPRSQFHEWKKLRKKIVHMCERRELVVCGVELKEKQVRKRVRLDDDETTEEDVFTSFCRERRIEEEVVEYGKGLLQ